MKPHTIGIDFDGTICRHSYPDLGEEIPGAIQTMKDLQARGHRLMLWTMRSGEELAKAVEFLSGKGIELWGVNENPQQHTWTSSKKQFCHLYIDDAALGCPLIHEPISERPFVDWENIRDRLRTIGLLGKES